MVNKGLFLLPHCSLSQRPRSPAKAHLRPPSLPAGTTGSVLPGASSSATCHPSGAAWNRRGLQGEAVGEAGKGTGGAQSQAPQAYCQGRQLSPLQHPQPTSSMALRKGPLSRGSSQPEGRSKVGGSPRVSVAGAGRKKKRPDFQLVLLFRNSLQPVRPMA